MGSSHISCCTSDSSVCVCFEYFRSFLWRCRNLLCLQSKYAPFEIERFTAICDIGWVVYICVCRLFLFQARIASQNEQYREKIENERSSFASVILCIIMWILTWCIAGFAVHAHYCGLTGASCETRTHI